MDLMLSYTLALPFVDVKTVALPAGKTGTLFLRGMACPDTFIDSLPSLLTANNQDEPYFISYNSYDEPLARRICAPIYRIRGYVAG